MNEMHRVFLLLFFAVCEERKVVEGKKGGLEGRRELKWDGT